MDIIFEINTPIYLRESNVTKEEARKETNDSYKIIEYKLENVNDNNAKDFFKKDESCSSKSSDEMRKYNCFAKYDDKTKNGIKKVVKIVVTKTNIKDAGLLKKTVACKTKKQKIIYNYKKILTNVTQRIFGIYGGGLSRKRRLKAKRYK